MDRKIRKLRKIELLELLLEQEKEIEKLETECEQLRAQLDIQRIKIEKAGSIAEVAIQLSGVLEAAQKAADLYLKSIAPEAEKIHDVESESTATKSEEQTDIEDDKNKTETDGF